MVDFMTPRLNVTDRNLTSINDIFDDDDDDDDDGGNDDDKKTAYRRKIYDPAPKSTLGQSINISEWKERTQRERVCV